MGRKFWLGFLYLVLGFGSVCWAIYQKDTGLVGSTAAACGTIAVGLTGVIWGNVQEHKAKNGTAAPS